MKTKLTIAAIVLFLSMPAVADFTPVTDGYELDLGDIRLPRNDGGTIAFKPCDECDYVTRRLSLEVRWQINGQAVTLSQFRERTGLLGDRDKHSVYISRHIESNQITNVSTTIRDSE